MVENIESMGPEDVDCVHHWVIDTPNGKISFGKCKKCDTQKDDFSNTLEGSLGDADKPMGNDALGGGRIMPMQDHSDF